MYFISTLILSIFLLNTVRTQSYDCSCTCCFGQGCKPPPLDNVKAQQCTDTSCLDACKARYYACTAPPSNGQAIGKCLTQTTTSSPSYSPVTGGPYLCQCYCCHSGISTCTPTLIGHTTAFSCQVGACSIACTNQYPYVCVNNQYGQTQGTCQGPSTPTPITPSGSSRCGCSCQMSSSGYHAYEMLTTNGCSSCNSTCQTMQLQCYNKQNTYCI